MKHFNSTVVQLEVAHIPVLSLFLSAFQFYCSPIRRAIFVSRKMPAPTYFNSTVVQLEALRVHVIRSQLSDFNSTVVQLEVINKTRLRRKIFISILL